VHWHLIDLLVHVTDLMAVPDSSSLLRCLSGRGSRCANGKSYEWR